MSDLDKLRSMLFGQEPTPDPYTSDARPDASLRARLAMAAIRDNPAAVLQVLALIDWIEAEAHARAG